MDILFGVLIAIVGLGLVFSGLRVFFALLPVLGFLTGFFAGATLIANWLGEGFLATATGWIVGLILGVVFGAVSYLWWYAGALMAAGASGGLLLSGLFSLFGVDNGTVLTIIAILGAVVFIILSLLLNLPVYVVLVNTAIVGAHLVITGLLLIFNRIDLNQFNWGIARAIVLDNWFWWLVMIVLSVVGIMAQLRMIERIRFPEHRWARADRT